MSVIFIPKQNDRKIINTILKIKNEIKFEIIGTISTGPNFSKSISELENNENDLFSNKSFLITGFHFRIGQHDFNYLRANESSSSPFIDSIKITHNYRNNNGDLDETTYLRIFQIFNEDFGVVNLTKNADLQYGKDVAHIAALHNTTLEKLEETNLNLIKQLQTYRDEIDKQKLEYQASLDANFLERKKLLQDEIASEKNKIRIEYENIENQKRDIDDKSNTHARRQIRKEIFEEIKSRQENFALTHSTQRMRLPIKMAFFFLISALLLFSLYTAIQITSLNSSSFDLFKSLNAKEILNVEANNQFDWKFLLLILKQTLGIAALIGVFIMYIRWEDRWMQTHADNEFHLKKFALDIERANWLVETGLEWKEAKGNSMPQELMLSLSKNLFEDGKNSQEEKIRPLNQLASSIIGSASLVKLKAGDSEIEINPNKLKKERDISL